MKAYLMYKRDDFIVDESFPAHFTLLAKDLELDVLFQALSGGDDFLYSVVRKACSQPLTEVQDIKYRQAILRDCLYNPEIFREFYKIVVDCLLMEKEKLHYGIFGRYPSAILHQSISFTRFLLDNLRKVRGIAEKNLLHVASSGMERLFVMIMQELNDEYLEVIEEHLRQMTFKKGVLLSARLGAG
ncbi:DNA mismatch repair protein MutS, partial [Klebsiella pneumoniae]|nr:DNA mismatch repair protein MutS [Klebsiella pneumoniae]MDZ6115345.1 DNA mismatch repair protein MutS [Klebsiella pneumoniae]